MRSLRTSAAIGASAGFLILACAVAVPVATPRPMLPPEERTPPQDEPCITRPPPPTPPIDWIAEGCPTRYGGCISGPDAAALSAYLQASRRWMAETYRRCDGR